MSPVGTWARRCAACGFAGERTRVRLRCTHAGASSLRARQAEAFSPPHSNLALEQTEVRLFRWTRMVAKPKRAGGKDAANGKNQARARGSGRGQGGKGGNGAAGAGARANPFGALEGVGDEDEPAARQQAGSGSEDEEEVEMLVADSNYLPYECMQGMCLSFALLPRARVEAVLEEPLSVCITGARAPASMLQRADTVAVACSRPLAAAPFPCRVPRYLRRAAWLVEERSLALSWLSVCACLCVSLCLCICVAVSAWRRLCLCLCVHSCMQA